MRSVHFAEKSGARVLNMSWGALAESQFLGDVVEHALSRNMILVASAGNEPTSQPSYPGAYPGVLSVSAMKADGSLWEQSNYGDFVTLAAPSQASFPVGYNGPPGRYGGTSIASAYVSRALGLYLAQNPDSSSTEAVAALKRALTDAGEKGKDPYYGYGALDEKALSKFLKN
jgi:hypothetical protein